MKFDGLVKSPQQVTSVQEFRACCNLFPKMKLLLVGHPKDINNTDDYGNTPSPFTLFNLDNRNTNSGCFVVDLPDPKTAESRNYLFIPNQHEPNKSASLANAYDVASTINTQQQQHVGGGNIYEIQHLQNSKRDKSNNSNKSYGSYFVDSTVVSDGNLYVCSPVDPLYFILSFFSKTSDSISNKWVPLDQMLSAFSTPIQNALDRDQLKNVMDFKPLSDDDEEDLLICRYNEMKACAWLKRKYFQCVEGTRNRLLRQRKQYINHHSTHGAFAPGFVMEAITTTAASTAAASTAAVVEEGEDEEEDLNIIVKRYALQLICEYLNELWRGKIVLALDFPVGYEVEIPKVAAAYININKTALIAPTLAEDDKKRKVAEPAKTFGLKKLAKVDTKGMKSLSSFFSSTSNSKTKK